MVAADDDTDRAMTVGRAIVAAKLRKQVVVMQRLARRHNAELVAHAIGQIQQMESLIPDSADRMGLMGLEGAAARAYFQTIGQILPEELRFETRSRRPPQDVANAALSFGYAVLLAEGVSALASVGLHPAVGLLHSEHEDRPSLALDLIEEFRPMIVDQVVISCAMRNEIRAEHGRREEGKSGVLLTRAGRENLLTAYERRMLQRTSGALPGFTGSLRRHLYRQAERIAGAILRDERWTGLAWR